jgi:hypothetical protein
VAKEELMDNDPTTFPELDADQVSKTIQTINEAIKDKPVDKKVKRNHRNGFSLRKSIS